MWGQGKRCKDRRCHTGIIPTRVGTSSSFVKLRKLVEDHPHACGDKWDLSEEEVEELGIIPTRVGTRHTLSGKLPLLWDHPHACGDKTYFVGKATASLGSSPRVWGQVFFIRSKTARFGIIPTRVGTSEAYFNCVIEPRDHPHACGDKKL